MTTLLSSTVPMTLASFALIFGTIALLLCIFILCKYDLKSKASKNAIHR